MKSRSLSVKAMAMALILLAACARENALINSNDVKEIKVTWIPHPRLRNAPLEMRVDPALLSIFIGKLNLSSEIDPIWISDITLYEGVYEITVVKKNDEREAFLLDGESVWHSRAAGKYYQNKEAHLFVYQILFLECIKRNIRLQ